MKYALKIKLKSGNVFVATWPTGQEAQSARAAIIGQCERPEADVTIKTEEITVRTKIKHIKSLYVEPVE